MIILVTLIVVWNCHTALCSLVVSFFCNSLYVKPFSSTSIQKYVVKVKFCSFSCAERMRKTSVSSLSWHVFGDSHLTLLFLLFLQWLYSNHFLFHTNKCSSNLAHCICYITSEGRGAEHALSHAAASELLPWGNAEVIKLTFHPSQIYKTWTLLSGDSQSPSKNRSSQWE